MDRSTKEPSEKERLSEIVKAARGESRPGTLGASALLIRLANRLDISITDLVIRLRSDTVRRTKYPVTEEVTEDGKIIYHSPVQIIEGSISK